MTKPAEMVGLQELPEEKEQASSSLFSYLVLANHLNLSPKWRSWCTRVQSGLVLILSFSLVVSLGPPGLVLLTYLVQLASFHEAVELSFTVTGCQELRVWTWQVLLVANVYWSDPSYIRIIDPALEKYLEPVCYFAYLCLMIWFLLGIEDTSRCLARYCHLAWTHMVILFTTVQAYLVLQTLEHGIAWYIFAMAIITINDIAAYMCGFFFGSRPLILLSPKKTLEGFIGGGLVTVLLGPLFGYLLLQSPRLLCPTTNLTVVDCDPYTAPLYSGPTPAFLYHTVIISIFASTVGPTAGFLCSGFKRACNRKNFGALIPGHGGVLDRCDCMFLMASFTYVYIKHFVKQ